MADQYIGADLGDSSPKDLTYATSTTSKAVELRVVSAGGMSRVETLKCVEAIKNWIQTTKTWVA